MTSLTLYGSNVASTTLSTACQLSTTTGGTETSTTTTAPNDSSQNYMEWLSKGGTGTDSASLPNPDGKGWLYDSSALFGQRIAAGNWACTIRANDTAGFTAITFIFRAWKYATSGGTYTSIGSITLTGNSMSSTTTAYSFPSTSFSLMDFATNEYAYFDIICLPTTGHWTGDPMKLFLSNSASAGVTNDLQITTPGFSPTPTTSSRTITPVTAALLTTNSRTIPSTAALLVTNSRTVPSKAALLTTNSRTIPSTAALLTTSSRTIAASAALIVRLTSGQFGLWANGTGTATFGANFRCTQYPDPSLSLAPVLPYVSNSSVFWTENVPTNTTRSIAVSTDGSGSSWTDVTSQNGSAIPIINGSGTVMTDVFTSNTSANYTSTSKSGGSTASWTYDTTNSRIAASGGSSALYLYSATSTNKIDLLADMDKSDAGGLAWCFVDSSDYYELGVYDDSSSSGFTNQLRLYKVSGGTRSLLGNSAIVFHRSTPGASPYHRIRVVMVTPGVISVSFDGVTAITYTDGSPLGAGLTGLRNDGGASRYYQLRLQALGDYVSGSPAGDIVSGKFLYTKIAPSTTDPTTSPQILTLTTSVRGPDVDAGALIPLLHVQTYPVNVMLNNEFDTLAKASGDYHWNVDKGTQPTFTSQLSFNQRGAKVAPFPLYSTDLLFTPIVVPSGSADLFRDQQTIYNCVNTISVTNEPFQADGTKTSWSMSYPLYSAPTIVINNVVQTVGVSGVDTNMAFYWTPNSTSIAQANGATPLTAGTIGYVSYVGIGSRQTVTANNAAGISAQASLENNSGIVEDVLDGSSVFGLTSLPMTVSQAQVYAQGLLNRFSNNNAIDLVATTTSDLLAGRPAPVGGQLLACFLPEFGINNRQLMVVQVTTTGIQKVDGNVLYQYQIEATDGANLSNWVQPLF